MSGGLIWAGWFGLAFALFAALEARALIKKEKTLSRSVVDLSRAWPPFPFILGMVVGMLVSHFYWPWCPYENLAIGFIQ